MGKGDAVGQSRSFTTYVRNSHLTVSHSAFYSRRERKS